MNEARDLYRLQEIELEIARTGQSLERAGRELGESDALKKGRLELESAREELGALEKKQRSLEWQIADLEAKLSSHEKDLYSGRVKNPKELLGLEREVGELRKKKDALETEILEIMDDVESRASGARELEERYLELERVWTKEQDALKSEIEALRGRLEDLEQKRVRAVSALGPGVLGLYEETKRRCGMAVARVEQGTCLGCHLSLTLADLKKARSGEFTRCSHCGRILYVE